ncbi:MAG: acyltransferase [Gammaproteobacteria bacterium]|nr:acyltransferase [Gammaproteobacteria bacterium]
MLKQTAKRIARLIALICMLPIYAAFLIASLFSSKDQTFSGFSQLISLFPGISGSYLRSAFYRLAMKKSNEELTIGFGTIFSQQQTELSQGVYIGPQCNIGKCHIKANCLLGSGVHIMSGKGQHNFSDINTPIREQGGSFETVTIGEDSWIGNGSLIMANIGKKCVIGAGSVVINDIPDFSIVAGNPAKIIKKRSQ